MRKTLLWLTCDEDYLRPKVKETKNTLGRRIYVFQIPSSQFTILWRQQPIDVSKNWWAVILSTSFLGFLFPSLFGKPSKGLGWQIRRKTTKRKTATNPEIKIAFLFSGFVFAIFIFVFLLIWSQLLKTHSSKKVGDRCCDHYKTNKSKYLCDLR